LDLDEMEVLRTVKAIGMSESWFEHRAVNTNVDGSSDVGLPQASDYARPVTNRWTAAGLWHLPMLEDDYFNPWKANYLRVVLSRRHQYFEGPSGSPAWQIISESRRAALAAGRDRHIPAP
jgi:hypothetical protein